MFEGFTQGDIEILPADLFLALDVQAAAVIPGHINQDRLTAVAGEDDIPGVTFGQVLTFIAIDPGAVDAGVLGDQGKGSGVAGTDGGVILGDQDIVGFLAGLVLVHADHEFGIIAQGGIGDLAGDEIMDFEGVGPFTVKVGKALLGDRVFADEAGGCLAGHLVQLGLGVFQGDEGLDPAGWVFFCIHILNVKGTEKVIGQGRLAGLAQDEKARPLIRGQLAVQVEVKVKMTLEELMEKIAADMVLGKEDRLIRIVVIPDSQRIRMDPGIC